MDLYYTSDTNRDTGAYLGVPSRGGIHPVMIDTWDWAHWPRTSLYRTLSGEIAVVQPFGGPPDYVIAADWSGIRVWDWKANSSDGWVYLGAFDWRPRGGYGQERKFDFVPASEQGECIPIGMEMSVTGVKGAPYFPRSEFHRERCPSPAPLKGSRQPDPLWGR